MARNAQAANVLTCFVCSAEHHKREAQVKGKFFLKTCMLPGADHGYFRYIKELAERVGALEGIRRPMSQTPGYQYGAYNEHSPQPDELAYGSRKRTLSMSEGLQRGRYNPETAAPFVRQGGAMEAPNTLEGRLNDQTDTTFEWDEYTVEE